MPTNKQTHPWIRFYPESGDERVRILSLKGFEEISSGYQFDVELYVPRDSTIDFEATVGRQAHIEFAVPGCPVRHLHGMIRKLTERHLHNDYLHYRAELVSHFQLFECNVQSRIFQDASVPDILRTVLGKLPRVAFELKGRYPVHNYCVQYDETDYEFACRIMAEEGIFFSFRHGKDGPEEMVLSDDSLATPLLSDFEKLIYQPADGSTLPEARIFRWRKRQSIRTGKFVVRDYNFQLPKADLQSAQSGPDSVRCGTVSHSLSANQGEYYEPVGGFADRQDGINSSGSVQTDRLNQLFSDSGRMAKIGVERLTFDSVVAHAVSTVANVTPGRRFELVRHRAGAGKYFVLRVDHEATQPPDHASDVVAEYRNRFECIPESAPYRPPQTTPRPRPGLQSAIVVGPAGEKIYTDKYGRIKVQFLWDRAGRNDAGSSCWLRVRQSHSGSKFGMLTTPRVGHEVLVGFDNGDCDRPIALASLYHADHPVPFPSPGNRTQLGFKVRSKNGDAPNFSGFAIEDHESGPHVHQHSERDTTISAENKHYVNATEQHHAVKKLHYRQTGGLPFIDHTQTRGQPSGSGGSAADGSGDGGSATTNSGPFGWNPNVSGYPGFNSAISLGHKSEQVLGLFTETYVGNHLEPIWNPIGFAAGMQMPLAADISFWPWALLFGGVPAQGNASVVMGTSSSAVYGPSFKIQRGPVIELKASLEYPKLWKWPQVGVALCAVGYTCIVTGQLFANGMDPSLKANVAGGILTLAQEIMLSLWVEFEATTASVKICDTAANVVKALTAYAASLSPGGEISAEKAGEYIAMATKKALETLAAAAPKSGLALEEESLEDAVTGVPEFQIGDGDHYVTAPGVTLRAFAEITDVTRSLQIWSLGLEGSTSFYSTAAMNVRAGAGPTIDLTAAEEVGLIYFNHGSTGATIIKTGPLEPPLCMPCIVVDPVGIQILAETMIVLIVDEMIVSLVPAAIEISNGASSLTITAAAIEVTSVSVQEIADGDGGDEGPEINETAANETKNVALISLE